MRETERRAAAAYAERFGEEPEIITSAPGRVNLIGEHTDYNGGFVLPCAVDRRVAVAMSRADDGGTLASVDFGQAKPLRDGSDWEKSGSWADYPRGVAWAMGIEQPFRAVFSGDVPRGAGLSSSAAIEAATALALDALLGLERGRKELAVACREAENGFVGVQSGIMDQYASLLCEEGSALFIDCRSLDAKTVPFDFEAAGFTLLVCDTNVHHAHTDSGYNDRKQTCEDAARTLGVEELRDATEDDLEKLDGEELKRARHIVTENARVLEAADALRGGDYAELGRLMYASHVSMRDDFEISVPEIDTFVELAREAGAVGARLTGGGFGGCAIALIPSGEVEAIWESARRTFVERGFREPEFYEFLPAAGAEIVAGNHRRERA
ncbi:MAG: galactokinase [Rubrobacteraceae bacterium]